MRSHPRRPSLCPALLGLCLLTPGLARAVDPPGASAPPPLVFYDIRAEEGLEALGRQLTDDLLVHLGAQPGLVVVGESELKVMVRHEQDKAALDCASDQACLARLSEAADAKRVVTGRVGRIGGTLMLTLKLADTSRGVVTGAESASAEAEGELSAAARSAAGRLLGLAGAPPTPRFRLTLGKAGTKVAVLDLGAHGVAAGLGDNLTQLLSLELKRFEGLGVISRDEIQAMLRFESDKQVLSCSDDVSCLIEIGGALGVDFLVAGSVGRLGEAWVLVLKLMDIGKATVVSRVSETFQGVESHLPQALRFATWRLVGKDVSGTGELAVGANIDEGQLVLDGGEPQAWPLGAPLPPLAAGRHGVSLTASDWFPIYQEVYVEPGRRTELRLELQARPSPWYARWYTWTAVGAAAAAGVVAVVLLQEDEPAGSDVLVTVE